MFGGSLLGEAHGLPHTDGRIEFHSVVLDYVADNTITHSGLLYIYPLAQMRGGS